MPSYKTGDTPEAELDEFWDRFRYKFKPDSDDSFQDVLDKIALWQKRPVTKLQRQKIVLPKLTDERFKQPSKYLTAMKTKLGNVIFRWRDAKTGRFTKK